MNKETLRKQAEERYQKLQFKDDFLFCKILVERPDIAKELLEMILGVKIKKVVPQNQKAIELTADGRGVRLDVYLDDENGTVYDLEMQTTIRADLPKRTRYYQGMIDLNIIGRGAKFSELKETYIIFICLEDPYNEGLHIYSFNNTCKERPDLLLGDGSHKILLNAAGTQNDVSDNLMDFFNLLLTGKGKTKLSKEIESEVEKARLHEEWRLEYMTLFMRDEEKREEGRMEGREEGRIDSIRKMLSKGYTKEAILDLDFSEDEISKAEQSMFVSM